MADGAIPIFCDLSAGVFRSGRKSLQQTNSPLGQVFSKNTLLLTIYPMEISPLAAPNADPFNLVTISGLSLTATLINPSTGGILATGSTWTGDSSANTLTGQLNLNTTEMDTYVSGKSGLVDIEFRFSSATLGEKTVMAKGEGTTGVQRVWRQYNSTGTPTPVENETYLTRAAIEAMFVPKAGQPGETYTLKSADGSKTLLIYVDNNGNLRKDPVT